MIAWRNAQDTDAQTVSTDCVVPPRIVALFGADLLFGQERANLEVLEALRERGAEVMLLTRKDNTGHIDLLLRAIDQRGFVRASAPYFDLTKKDGLYSATIGAIVRMISAHRALAHAVRKYGATHVYLFNLRYAVNFLPYLARTPLKIVYRAGDVPPLHNSLYRTAWALVRRRVTEFVANSEYIKLELVRLGVSSERLSVIYSRPPNRRPVADSEKLTSLRGVLSGGPNIVYVGQLTEAKGVDILIDAVRLIVPIFPDVRLIMVGRLDHPQDAFARELRDRSLRDPMLSERVIFTGYTEDVQHALSLARVHAAPSVWSEPLANSVLEAKEAGVPSVVFASGGLPEVITDGEDGSICTEKTSEALAETLLPYLRDADMARRLGGAARLSLQRLGVTAFADRWYELMARA